MRAAKYLSLLLIVSSLGSCGIFKRNARDKHMQEAVEVVKKDSVETNTTVKKADISERTIDRGTVVTENETTTVKERGGKSNITIDKKSLKPGDNYLKDSAGNDVRVVLDTLNNVLNIEFSTPTERETTTSTTRTTENKDQSSERNKSKQDSTHKQVATQASSEKKTLDKSDEKKSTPSFWGIISLAVGVIMVIGFLLWYFGIKRKK